MRHDALKSSRYLDRYGKKTKQKYRTPFFSFTLNKFGSLGKHNAMQNDRLKPVHIPLSAVKLFYMINRLLQAWYCVRQGCQILSKKIPVLCGVFFPRTDLNIEPILACHVSNKRKQILDRINLLVSYFFCTLYV